MLGRSRKSDCEHRMRQCRSVALLGGAALAPLATLRAFQLHYSVSGTCYGRFHLRAELEAHRFAAMQNLVRYEALAELTDPAPGDF
jgi:hypothetical protein